MLVFFFLKNNIGFCDLNSRIWIKRISIKECILKSLMPKMFNSCTRSACFERLLSEHSLAHTIKEQTPALVYDSLHSSFSIRKKLPIFIQYDIGRPFIYPDDFRIFHMCLKNFNSQYFLTIKVDIFRERPKNVLFWHILCFRPFNLGTYSQIGR